MKNQIIKLHSACIGLCCSFSCLSTQLPAQDYSNVPEKPPIIQNSINTSNSNLTPVQRVYSRDEILQSGVQNTADFIRNLPINSFGSLRPGTSHVNQSDENISLRGLGASRTLVLIDGRRTPKSPHSGKYQNINLIPIAAIERIEISSEGASAVYGSDAIGGVINIVTRSDFQGTELTLGTASPSLPKQGGETETGSIVFGTASDKSSLMAGISWDNQELVLKKDVPWSYQGASVFGNNLTTITHGYDNFDFTALPGACESLGHAFYIAAESHYPNACFYDFNTVVSEEVSSDDKSFFTHAHHRINENWQIAANALFSDSEFIGHLGPDMFSSYYTNPLSVDSPNNPTNPNSPLFDSSLGLEPQPINWWHRFVPLGSRIIEVSSQLNDLSFLVDGKVDYGQFQFGLNKNNNTMDQTKNNLLNDQAAASYIADGTYSLMNPFNTPDSILNAIKKTLHRNAVYNQTHVFGTFTFDITGFNEQSIPMLIGIESRNEKLDGFISPQSETGLHFGPYQYDIYGKRNSQALFLHTHIPFNDIFTVDSNIRYDKFSDAGEDFSAKLSFVWQLMDELSLSGAFSHDFRAPTLDEINLTQSYGLGFYGDAIIGDGTFELITIGNKELRSEKTNQFSFSMQYQPQNWLNLGLNYWKVKVINPIKLISPTSLLNIELYGNQVPRGLNCEFDTNDFPIRCTGGYANWGQIESSGVNFTLKTNYDIWQGLFNSTLIVNHIFQHQVNNNDDIAGNYESPNSRAQWQNSFSKGNWSIHHQTHFISDQEPQQYREYTATPSWVIHNLQLNYNTPWQSQLTLGANNLFEKEPPIITDRQNRTSYNRNLYNGFGRVVYARYTQEF
jgi:iron complex outermembrane receptor protein